MRKPTRKGSKTKERVPPGGRARERVKQDQRSRGFGGAKSSGSLILVKRASKRPSARKKTAAKRR